MSRLNYRGNGFELFVLGLKNKLLTIITLGFYSFKAKVNMRKYNWSHMSFEGESFSFSGQTMDQVRGLGWLIAVGIGLLFVAGAAYLVHPALAIPFLYCGFVFLTIRMSFGGFRYKVRNTVYRGLRGNVSPQAYDLFVKQSIKGTLLSIVTLGIYRSFNQIELLKIKWNHTSWGRQPFSFKGEGKDYFWICFKGTLLSVFTFGIYAPWAIAHRHRYIADHLKFAGESFKFDIYGFDLLLLIGIAFFGTIFSLGIAFPWIKAMVISDLSSKLSYAGKIAWLQIVEDFRASVKSSGDMAGDAIDLDSDLDFAV